MKVAQDPLQLPSRFLFSFDPCPDAEHVRSDLTDSHLQHDHHTDYDLHSDGSEKLKMVRTGDGW